jgi:CBS domain-containing protein
MLVEAVMSRSVLTIAPNRSIEAAALLMHQHRIRHVPRR